MSFNIALSGLQATTQDLNTISNNIANASTSGFRGGRSEFASIYNGGQAGGVGVMSTSQNFSKGGSLTYTGRQLDMGIQGEGFFVLKGNDGGAMYARAGMFHKDSEGFITDPVGSRLQGYSVNAMGRLQTGNVGDLQVQTASLAAKATTEVRMVSNLDARVDVILPTFSAVPFDPANNDSYQAIETTTVNDSLGNAHVVNQYYVKTAQNEVTVHYTLDGTLLAGQTTTLKFDSNGVLDPTTTKQPFDIAIPSSSTNLKFDINFDKSTHYAAKYNAFNPKNIDSYHSIGTTSVYDSLGTEHVVTQYYVKTAPNEWTVNYTLDGTLLPDQTTLKFDSKGILDPTTTKDTFDLTLSNGASPLKFDINFDKSTQYAAKYNNSSLSQDGYTSGELKGVRLDDNGMLYGTYTNGQDQLQGQVVLANFSNPNGLSAVSNNAWVATNTAGQAIIGSPSTGTMGTVTGGYLEGSNVDTTAEMVNLMSAQRNYQSNAKVLDVNSTMQQALLNAI